MPGRSSSLLPLPLISPASLAGWDAAGAVLCLLLKQPDTKRPQELHAPTGWMSAPVNPARVPKRENGIVCSGEGESSLKNVIEEFS